MITKKFLIQLECAENTRFKVTDAQLTEIIGAQITDWAEFLTNGPVPKVTVTPEEQPVPIGFKNFGAANLTA